MNKKAMTKVTMRRKAMTKVTVRMDYLKMK